MRQRILAALLSMSTLLPLFAHAQWLGLAADEIATILSVTVRVLVGVALIVFMWGVVLFIKSSGNEKAYEEAKKRIFWGLIILFVIISMWGFVKLLQVLIGVKNTAVVDAPSVKYTY